MLGDIGTITGVVVVVLAGVVNACRDGWSSRYVWRAAGLWLGYAWGIGGWLEFLGAWALTPMWLENAWGCGSDRGRR